MPSSPVGISIEAVSTPLLSRSYPQTNENLPVERTPPELSEQAERDEKKIKGLRLRLNEKGGIDWAGHEAANNKERLETILKADEHVKLLNSVSSFYTPEAAGELLNAFSLLEQIGMRMVFKYDAEIAKQAFSINAEQHKGLDPVAARLANKWLPAAMLRWQDEIMFCSMMIGMTKAQIELANTLQRNKIAEIQAVAAGRIVPEKGLDPNTLVMTAEGNT